MFVDHIYIISYFAFYGFRSKIPLNKIYMKKILDFLRFVLGLDLNKFKFLTPRAFYTKHKKADQKPAKDQQKKQHNYHK